MLCQSRQSQIIDLPPIIGTSTFNQSELQEIVFAKSASFGVKGILLLMVHKIQLYFTNTAVLPSDCAHGAV